MKFLDGINPPSLSAMVRQAGFYGIFSHREKSPQSLTAQLLKTRRDCSKFYFCVSRPILSSHHWRDGRFLRGFYSYMW